MSDTLSADVRDPTMDEPSQNLAVSLLHRARRSLLPFVAVAAGWEAFAHFGSINQELFPPIETVVQRFWELLLNGILAKNTWSTVERLLFGWIVAAILSLIVGFLMARLRPVEEFFLPLISVLIPIPSIAWVPIFILWFGLGNTSVVILVIFSSSLPMTLNIWTGMRSVRPVWLRAARSFEVDGFRLFRKVVLPGSLPFVMTAFRIGAAQAWRAVIAGEMVAAAVGRSCSHACGERTADHAHPNHPFALNDTERRGTDGSTSPGVSPRSWRRRSSSVTRSLSKRRQAGINKTSGHMASRFRLARTPSLRESLATPR